MLEHDKRAFIPNCLVLWCINRECNFKCVNGFLIK